MLDGILILWLVLTLLSLIFVIYDLVKVTPEATVMKWGWILVVLYTGPVGLFFYLLSCKEPMPGTHEAFIAPHWKQALGSMVHCLAGDVTGIILAAFVLAIFKVPISIEILIEYLAGFGFGLLIFQSLFMRKMMGGSYIKALKTSFYPEFVSMNMIMSAMIPVMVIWTYLDPKAAAPTSLHFWGKMSLATILAGIVAFPINSWLVKRGLKHGMTTIRSTPPTPMDHAHMSHEHPQMVSKKEKRAKLGLTLLCLLLGILISVFLTVFLRSI